MNKVLSQSQISKRLRTCIKECNNREKKHCAVCEEFITIYKQQQENIINDSAKICCCYDGMERPNCDCCFSYKK